jgi:hypothetical protein
MTMKRWMIGAALLAGGMALLMAQSRPLNLATTNASTTIATGNTFQQVLAALSNRQSLTIENNNASDSCWVFVGPSASATKATSILLLSGGSYTRYYPYVPSDAIQATCATTSDTLYVDTQ